MERLDETLLGCDSGDVKDNCTLGGVSVPCSHSNARGEPVWPSGKALGWSAEGPRFDPLRLSFPLKKMWLMDTVLRLCPHH